MPEGVELLGGRGEATATSPYYWSVVEWKRDSSVVLGLVVDRSGVQWLGDRRELTTAPA